MAKENPIVPAAEEKEQVGKMTFEEYQSKYSGSVNAKRAKSLLTIVIAAIGIGIFALLTLLVLRVFEMNEYAGYASIAVAVLLFVLCYIVPLVKIQKTKPFMVYVEENNAAKAKRYNKKLREEIADKMIEITAKTKDLGWYKTESVGKLAIARQTNDDAALKAQLTEMYNGEIKKQAGSLIRSYSIQIGMITAISQSDKIDTLVVGSYELNLIKRLIYLYGYRPSDAKMLKIYSQILTNALIAYGASSVTSNIAIGVVNSIGGAMEKIPVLGQVVSTAIGSTAQGIINASMTVVIGFQTLHYLRKEYHLQDILDGVEVAEEDEDEIMEEARKEVVKGMKNAKKTAKAAQGA